MTHAEAIMILERALTESFGLVVESDSARILKSKLEQCRNGRPDLHELTLHLTNNDTLLLIAKKSAELD